MITDNFEHFLTGNIYEAKPSQNDDDYDYDDERHQFRDSVNGERKSVAQNKAAFGRIVQGFNNEIDEFESQINGIISRKFSGSRWIKHYWDKRRIELGEAISELNKDLINEEMLDENKELVDDESKKILENSKHTDDILSDQTNEFAYNEWVGLQKMSIDGDASKFKGSSYDKEFYKLYAFVNRFPQFLDGVEFKDKKGHSKKEKFDVSGLLVDAHKEYAKSYSDSDDADAIDNAYELLKKNKKDIAFYDKCEKCGLLFLYCNLFPTADRVTRAYEKLQSPNISLNGYIYENFFIGYDKDRLDESEEFVREQIDNASKTRAEKNLDDVTEYMYDTDRDVAEKFMTLLKELMSIHTIDALISFYDDHKDDDSFVKPMLSEIIDYIKNEMDFLTSEDDSDNDSDGDDDESDDEEKKAYSKFVDGIKKLMDDGKVKGISIISHLRTLLKSIHIPDGFSDDVDSIDDDLNREFSDTMGVDENLDVNESMLSNTSFVDFINEDKLWDDFCDDNKEIFKGLKAKDGNELTLSDIKNMKTKLDDADEDDAEELNTLVSFADRFEFKDEKEFVKKYIYGTDPSVDNFDDMILVMPSKKAIESKENPAYLIMFAKYLYDKQNGEDDAYKKAEELTRTIFGEDATKHSKNVKYLKYTDTMKNLSPDDYKDEKHIEAILSDSEPNETYDKGEFFYIEADVNAVDADGNEMKKSAVEVAMEKIKSLKDKAADTIEQLEDATEEHIDKDDEPKDPMVETE